MKATVAHPPAAGLCSGCSAPLSRRAPSGLCRACWRERPVHLKQPLSGQRFAVVVEVLQDLVEHMPAEHLDAALRLAFPPERVLHVVLEDDAGEEG